MFSVSCEPDGPMSGMSRIIPWREIENGELVSSSTGGLTYRVPEVGLVWVSGEDACRAAENNTDLLLIRFEQQEQIISRMIWIATPCREGMELTDSYS